MTQQDFLFVLLVAALLPGCGSPGRGPERPGSSGAERRCETAVRPMGFTASIVLSGEERVFDTQDGRFRIHYTVSGGDAVERADVDPEDGVPDYITLLEQGFADAWTNEVARLGWRPPPSDGSFGGDSRYDVYVMKCGSGCNGYTQTISQTADGGWSSFIAIDPWNPRVLGKAAGNEALTVKSVCVHEFNHACQFAYGVFEGWWGENCATWMEDEIYDLMKNLTLGMDVLLAVRFGENTMSVFSFGNRYEYVNFIWPKYMVDSRGRDADIIRRIWERARRGSSSTTPWFLGIINNELAQSGGSLASDYQKFAEWNYISCAYDDDAHYFRGAFPETSYGSVKIDSLVAAYPSSVTQGNTLISPLGAAYIQLVPDPNSLDLGITFTGEGGTQWGLSLVLHRPTCEYTTSEYIVPASGTTTTTVQDMNAFDRIVLAVQDLDASYGPGRSFTCTATASGARAPGPPRPPHTLTKIGLVPTALTLSPGAEEQFGAIGTSSDCTRANLTRSATWTSGAPQTAAIDRYGRLTALSPGTALITAERDGVKSPSTPVRVLGEIPRKWVFRSRGWGCQASLTPGYRAPSSWGTGILAVVGIIYFLGVRRRRMSSPDVVPQARRVASYQEYAWRIAVFASLLDFSILHVSQEVRYFPWPNIAGIFILCCSLIIFTVIGGRRRRAPCGGIRYPHHLASMLWALGFPFALSSGVGILFAALLIIPTYFYRMDVEDDVLKDRLGKEYSAYIQGTERLIPWIY